MLATYPEHVWRFEGIAYYAYSPLDPVSGSWSGGSQGVVEFKVSSDGTELIKGYTMLGPITFYNVGWCSSVTLKYFPLLDIPIIKGGEKCLRNPLQFVLL